MSDVYLGEGVEAALMLNVGISAMLPVMSAAGYLVMPSLM